MKKKKIDFMLVATFSTTIFYAATYPYIHRVIMQNVTDGTVAWNQIINCVSLVIFGTLWNKTDVLFKFYPAICVFETLLGVCSTVFACVTGSVVVYYILDTLIFAIVTRNLCCGGIKLRTLRYNKEKREEFDNNDNSVAAVATIIGSIVAMRLHLDFKVMLWLATFGNAVDNVFYIFVYKSTVKRINNGD